MKKVMNAVTCLLLACVFCGCASIQKPLFSMGLWFERYRSDLSYKTVQVDEQTFAYLEREGEGETIVLLHGFTADKDNWIRFVRYMPEEYRILAIDMPGHGDSDRDIDQTYKVEYFTSEVARTIEALGLERIHLAGNSFGGLVSTLYALDNPNRVITLGLFDSSGIFSPTPSVLEDLLDKGDNPFLVTSSADFDRLTDLGFYEQPYFPWPARSVFARKYIQRRELYQKMWNDLYDALMEKDLRDRLPELKMPTFLLWGDEDRIHHVSCVEVFKRYLPDVQVVIMENCGHLPMLERPEETAGHYARFLRQVSGTKGGGNLVFAEEPDCDCEKGGIIGIPSRRLTLGVGWKTLKSKPIECITAKGIGITIGGIHNFLVIGVGYDTGVVGFGIGAKDEKRMVIISPFAIGYDYGPCPVTFPFRIQ